MAAAVTVWNDIDERVFVWLANEKAPALRWIWQLPKNEASKEIAGLSNRQVDDALQRLHGHGLIDSHGRAEAIGYVRYDSPRVTGLGHRVLGAWPDLENISAVSSVQLALRAVAEDAPPESVPLLRRAIGVVGDIGDSIVASAIASEAAELGREP